MDAAVHVSVEVQKSHPLLLAAVRGFHFRAAVTYTVNTLDVGEGCFVFRNYISGIVAQNLMTSRVLSIKAM